MSALNLAGAALAVACVCSLGWCLSLGRRVRRLEQIRSITSAQPGAQVVSNEDCVPRALRDDGPTAAVTPAAHAVVAVASVQDPDVGDTNTAQAQADGERIRRKREAAGWTRSKLAAVCNLPAATLKDLEVGRRLVAATTRAQLEACLDAELGKQGVLCKKQ